MAQDSGFTGSITDNAAIMGPQKDFIDSGVGCNTPVQVREDELHPEIRMMVEKISKGVTAAVQTPQYRQIGGIFLLSTGDDAGSGVELRGEVKIGSRNVGIYRDDFRVKTNYRDANGWGPLLAWNDAGNQRYYPRTMSYTLYEEGGVGSRARGIVSRFIDPANDPSINADGLYWQQDWWHTGDLGFMARIQWYIAVV